MRSANMKIRIDPAIKSSADEVFKAIGISTSDGINIFLKRVIAEGGIPFEVKAPNARLLAAMHEGEEIANNPNTKRYDNAESLFEELDNEISD